MTLKKSDGTEFKLKTPNPLMLKQDEWSNDVILHNMTFEERTYIPRIIKIKEVKLQEVPKEEKIETIEVTEKIVETVEKVEESKKEENIFDNSGKLFCFVLPAEIKTATDSLYGEKIKRIVYGNKFTMEIEKRNQDTFSCVFWTNARPLEKSSIMYIPTDKQWWKVSSCQKIENGFL
jgi:hypothetical protein